MSGHFLGHNSTPQTARPAAVYNEMVAKGRRFPLDEETRKQFEEMDEWMDRTEDWMLKAEKRIMSTSNLVRTGIPFLVDTQTKLDALIDSHTRLYAAQQKTEETMHSVQKTIQALAEAQTKTERTLQAYLESLKGRNAS